MNDREWEEQRLRDIEEWRPGCAEINLGGDSCITAGHAADVWCDGCMIDHLVDRVRAYVLSESEEDLRVVSLLRDRDYTWGHGGEFDTCYESAEQAKDDVKDLLVIIDRLTGGGHE